MPLAAKKHPDSMEIVIDATDVTTITYVPFPRQAQGRTIPKPLICRCLAQSFSTIMGLAL